jgi:hypothetical protein
MTKLVLFMPDGTTLDVPLNRERMSIGRRADNDICLPNLAVSGEHAIVVTILADSFLEDLGSTNGTLVNGEAVAKHFLRDRDKIEIGRHKLVYCVDDEAVIASDVPGGVARINARDFGGRVETARPFLRVRGAHGLAPAESVDAASNAQAPVSAASPAAPAGVPLAAAPPSPPVRELPQVASVKVLSGVSAGVSIPLTKAETTIGRPGVQVASIMRVGDAFRLKPLEGASPPSVNGKPVERDGVNLAPSDVIEIAGTRLEFADPTRDSSRDDVAA